MKIVLVNGSPNIGGETYGALLLLKEELTNLGGDCKIVNAAKGVMSCKHPFCVCCSTPCNKSCYEGTYLEECFEELYTADFVVFGSPVYFGGMSAQLKGFFDKMRIGRNSLKLCGKKAGCVSVGASAHGGQETAIRAMHDVMLVMGMTIVGNGSTLGGGHYGVMLQKPIKEDKGLQSGVASFAKRILDACK